jgi:enoyl-CoA hydratase/carnithine racemase
MGVVTPSWTHFKVDRRSPSYWRVTFDHPPVNTITATTVVELSELVRLIEGDPELNVVVFESANPDFFLAHYDTEHNPAATLSLPPGPTGMHAWLDLTVRLTRAPVVSIAQIRGRCRGAGSEFVLACDLRFASRENALLGQPEVGIGVPPGGGPMARLSRLLAAAARWRSCSSRTISTVRVRSCTATSTGPSRTTCSMPKSRRWRPGSQASNTMQSLGRSCTSTR